MKFAITAQQAKDALRDFQEGVNVDVNDYLYRAEQLIYALAKKGENAILYKHLIEAVLYNEPLSVKSETKIDVALRQVLVKNGFQVKDSFLTESVGTADYVVWS
jgi:hypothetical protein